VPEHEFSVDTARSAARDDRLEAWVADFLSSPGSDNPELAELLSEPPRHWLGPVLVPIRLLNRLAGPPGEPVLCPVDDDEWRDDVEEMKDEIEEGWEPPPLVVTFRDGQLVLEDGNHRVESLRRSGRHEGWAVIAFDDRETRDQFHIAAASGQESEASRDQSDETQPDELSA
jgi:hypothetical protein